jgi:uncharacterized phage protein (TIGR01671 family)
MNRPIKFRVWDTKHKKFLIGIPPMEYMLDHDEWSWRDIEEDPCVYLNNVFSKDFNGRLIFQQYTGLTDKNNKPIYEGDIVKFSRSFEKERQIKELKSFVRFDEGQFGFDLIGFNDMFFTLSDECGIEVIGNIFEHSELLKTI